MYSSDSSCLLTAVLAAEASCLRTAVVLSQVSPQLLMLVPTGEEFRLSWLIRVGILQAESVKCIVYGLSEHTLFKEVCADVSSIQISHFTFWPDLLQTQDPCTGDVGVLLGLDHNNETGVDRD